MSMNISLEPTLRPSDLVHSTHPKIRDRVALLMDWFAGIDDISWWNDILWELRDADTDCEDVRRIFEETNAVIDSALNNQDVLKEEWKGLQSAIHSTYSYLRRIVSINLDFLAHWRTAKIPRTIIGRTLFYILKEAWQEDEERLKAIIYTLHARDKFSLKEVSWLACTRKFTPGMRQEMFDLFQRMYQQGNVSTLSGGVISAYCAGSDEEKWPSMPVNNVIGAMEWAMWQYDIYPPVLNDKAIISFIKNSDVPFDVVKKVFEFGISKKDPKKYRRKSYMICSLEIYIAYYEVIIQRDLIEQEWQNAPEANRDLIRQSDPRSIERYFALQDRIKNKRQP